MRTHRFLSIAGFAAVIAVVTGCVAPIAGSESEPPFIAGGRFEASGLASVPGSQGVLFVDDSQNKQVYWMELDADGKQVGNATAVPLGADVLDPEGITASPTHYYIVGSQSKRGPDGAGLVRFAFAEANHKVSGVESISGLKGWLSEHVPELSGAAALNIEGLAWDPQNQRLLLGLRAPLVEGDALVIPLSLMDRTGPFTTSNLQVDGRQAIRLPLGGAGIRSIEYDEAARAFQLIAASDGDAAYRLVEWSGQPGAKVRDIATFPKNLKPEGVARVSLGKKSMRVVVFDTGRVAVLN
jgi:hypothetical protein